MRLACLILGLAAAAGCAAPAPAPFELHLDDYAQVRGEYALADGHVIHLEGTRRHPSLAFDDGSTRPLRALSPEEFATADGCVRVAFDRHSNGSVAGMRVTRACAAP